MNNNRPRFLDYVLVQNNIKYKFDGKTNDKKGSEFWEEHYPLNRFIIDTMIVIVYIIITACFAHFITKYTFYNTNLPEVLILFIYPILVLPLVALIVRIFSSIRWLFVKFNACENKNLDKTYYDIYNKNVLFMNDTFFINKKHIELYSEYRDKVSPKYRVLGIMHFILLPILTYAMIIVYFEYNYSYIQFIILFLTIYIVFSLLSHAITFCIWKKDSVIR